MDTRIRGRWLGVLLTGLLIAAGAELARAQQGAAAVPQADSTVFDADGTAHLTRVVPPPSTVSPEARRALAPGGVFNHYRPPAPGTPPPSLTEQRRATDAWRARGSAAALAAYPARVHAETIAGVRTDIIDPLQPRPENAHRILISIHGGGFITDSGSIIEGAPIAHLSGIRVVSVYYRLAPEHPFPAAVDDVEAVYRQLLKSYKPSSIGVFGTSAGAIITAELSVRLKHDHLPEPAALGIFSGLADFSRPGDSRELFALDGLSGAIAPSDPHHASDPDYVGGTNPRDPLLSPLFADLHGLPPTLLVTSTRDMLLSGTTIYHRALLAAGVNAELVVYEALPHAFWYHFELPETREAVRLMADYFAGHLAR